MLTLHLHKDTYATFSVVSELSTVHMFLLTIYIFINIKTLDPLHTSPVKENDVWAQFPLCH